MFSTNIMKSVKTAASTITIAGLTMMFAAVLFGFSSAGDAVAAECSKTTRETAIACRAEANDDYHIFRGNCLNLADPVEQAACFEFAGEEFSEALELCRDQRDARRDICGAIGYGPYDPEMDPANFVDPLNIGVGVPPNPYFPLVAGNTWEYAAKDADGEVIEIIKVEVLKKTKEILDITCIVVRDRVWEIDEEGSKTLIEDTDDWYAQDFQGNVWYMGEIAKNFEDGELIDVEGSWKSGRDNAKSGILMWADPQPGVVYRQEFALGDAEDMGQVIDIIPSMSVRGKFYQDVLKTKDYTPIDPGEDAFEFKYYAPGVGLILEENPAVGEDVTLVKMSTDTAETAPEEDGDNDD